MGAGLYDAAFATLGRLYGRDACSAITSLTSFGGFASTICWPLSAFLVTEVGWRGACIIYAAIQLLIALPVYLVVLLRGAPLQAPMSGHANFEAMPVASRASVMHVAFLAMAITLAAVISSLVSVHLLTILRANGATLAAAVGLGALVGPSQVAARAVEIFVARFHHPIWTKITPASLVAFGMSSLWAGIPFTPAALALYVAGIGLESIAPGTLPLALFGPLGYSTLMGRLAMPSLLAQASAPWLGAGLSERFGAHVTLAAVSCAATLNVALTLSLAFMAIRRR